jgi:hypothetical protein
LAWLSDGIYRVQWNDGTLSGEVERDLSPFVDLTVANVSNMGFKEFSNSSHLIIPPKVEFPSTQTARIEAAVAVLGLQSCVENDFSDVQKAAAKFLIDQFKVT